MKPLASPVTEYRVMAGGELLGGAVLAAAAVAVDGPVAAAVMVPFMTAFFGAPMYLLAYRRFARRAVQDPARAPTEEREPAGRTTRRVLLMAGVLLAFMAVIAAAIGTAGGVAGITLGSGAGLWVTSRQLRRWEKRSGRRLLREPRWRWSRHGERGWGRGRGMMDPQDFYVEAGST